ncbi:hypothetical protein [Arthrobacter sp. CAN_A6]|uniref:hypothetical protein n=1 Tax=Arthrobacter sp. CAN_A6 TaxID=2787721 RepID=UPI002FF3BF56
MDSAVLSAAGEEFVDESAPGSDDAAAEQEVRTRAAIMAEDRDSVRGEIGMTIG